MQEGIREDHRRKKWRKEQRRSGDSDLSTSTPGPKVATHPPRQGRQNHTRACRELFWPWHRHVPMTAQLLIHRHLRKHRRQKCQVGRQVLPRPVCPRTKCAGHLRRSAWPRWNPADEERQKFLGKWRRHSTNAICGTRCVRERTTAAFKRCSHSLCYEKPNATRPIKH